MTVSWSWITDKPKINGFRYLWLKEVKAFNPEFHCAMSLVGSYNKSFSPKMPANTEIEADYPEGALLYFCGVTTPYKWNDNFHLAGSVKSGESLSITTHLGDELIVKGLELIYFDDKAARRNHPNLSAKFLTCRNFQFGSQVLERTPNENT